MESVPSPASDSLLERGGRIPGARGQHAYLLQRTQPAPLPVLLAVPHAGRCYPEELIACMRTPAEASLKLEDRFVDIVAAALARQTGAALLVAHAPRAMIDLNRAPDDIDWSMVADVSGFRAQGALTQMGRRARSGLGLVPRRLSGLGEIWNERLRAADLAARIEGVHRPYHKALSQTLESLRDRWGAALLLDLHSMPPLGMKSGSDPAPDYVLGDRFGGSCGCALSAIAMDHLGGAGRRAAHNRPYAGGYVLEHHAAPARGIHALQVELCRTAYLDEALSEPGPGLPEVVRVLASLVRRLTNELTASVPFSEAAE